MACRARWGLKLLLLSLIGPLRCWLNGLWCPLGFETPLGPLELALHYQAKWPVVPVGV